MSTINPGIENRDFDSAFVILSVFFDSTMDTAQFNKPIICPFCSIMSTPDKRIVSLSFIHAVQCGKWTGFCFGGPFVRFCGVGHDSLRAGLTQWSICIHANVFLSNDFTNSVSHSQQDFVNKDGKPVSQLLD